MVEQCDVILIELSRFWQKHNNIVPIPLHLALSIHRKGIVQYYLVVVLIYGLTPKINGQRLHSSNYHFFLFENYFDEHFIVVRLSLAHFLMEIMITTNATIELQCINDSNKVSDIIIMTNFVYYFIYVKVEKKNSVPCNRFSLD